MSRFRIGCLGTLAVVVIGFALFLNFILNMAKVGQEKGTQQKLPRFDEKLVAEAADGKGDAKDKVALLTLRGVITSAEPGSLGETMVDDLKLQLQQAIKDKEVKALVLLIDSPGGEVTASDQLYQAVVKAREKKPVVIYMNALAASGGYYIACGGTHLMASDTTLTGSIGVIMQSFNYAETFNKVGLKTVTIKSGKFKDMLSGSRPTTEEEIAYVQGMIDQSYSRFLGIVAKERKQEAQALKDTVADGRVLSGTDALAAKLIDSTGSVEDAYAKAMELGQCPNATVVRYESSFQLGKFLQMLGSTPAKPGKVELALPEPWTSKVQAGRLYYLPAFALP